MSAPLFYLDDKSPVFRGDKLHVHPDYWHQAGALVTAEFESETRAAGQVVVRSDNGAVPSIPLSALSRKPHPDIADSEAISQILDCAVHEVTRRDLKLWRASRQEAPVASGEPTDAQIRKVINDARYAWSAWRGNDSEDSFVGSALRKLFASPSGAGLGGAVASSEAVTALKWCAAALQALIDSRGESGAISMIVSGEKRSLEDVLDMADAALASQPGCAVEGEAVAWEYQDGTIVKGGTRPDERASWKPLGYLAAIQGNSTEMTEGAKGSRTDGKEEL